MNLESYLTEIIQEAVRNTIQEQFNKLKDEINVIATRSSVKHIIKTEPESKIIRPKELADMLSVSTVTVWRMQKRGELPPRFKISNRAVGWLRSDIEEWLVKRKKLNEKQ